MDGTENNNRSLADVYEENQVASHDYVEVDYSTTMTPTLGELIIDSDSGELLLQIDNNLFDEVIF